MTKGQKRALRELERLCAADPSNFELLHEPVLGKKNLSATVSLRIGAIQTSEGGLDLRERENFIVSIPPEFPFDRPQISVSHLRFAGFPHVIWGKTLCIYQSSVEWNPSDGLFGFFDRLRLWIGRAAINEMDPIEGPLEPPHYATDFSKKPFVIRVNAPCSAGEFWIGLAVLKEYDNRIELVGWDDLSHDWPQQGQLAFAVMLPEPLPMEFPSKGADLFRELKNAGMSRERIVKHIALAAYLTSDGEPIHLVLGLPMRRGVDGSRRLHIAVWVTEAKEAQTLRLSLPKDTDPEEILNIRDKLRDSLTSIFELSTIKWCKILEDRDEIVLRRDNGTPFAWFVRKKALILGCGALGSWVAEMAARARPDMIHVVDNGVVKPGVLARQNFELQDIGSNKADALVRRLRAISYGCGDIVAHNHEAHAFVTENVTRLKDYDVVFDCTASSIFQMKLERDWERFSRHSPLFVSLVVDAQSRHCLCVVIPKESTGGVWDAYLSLKRRLCIDGNRPEITTAFYSELSAEQMFQPEPGCSDPTFVGSTADVTGLVSGALNVALCKLGTENFSTGIALSAPDAARHAGAPECVKLPQFYQTLAGEYRVRIALSAFAQARAWVSQNNRSRSSDHETGGLLWGVWDDAAQVVWVFDMSGPPPDSQHNPAHFICGVTGTVEEHRRRVARTHGVCGFVGYWHTHPNIPSDQSIADIGSMATLVSSIGLNQKRALMLIFGRASMATIAGIYIYESQSLVGTGDLISVGMSQIALGVRVV
jgi:hypothetical protein